MKKNPLSIFVKHYNRLIDLTSPELLEHEMLLIVNESQINPYDKRKIQLNIASYNKDINKLQYYLTNSMLKFQGLGVI